jgi:hypothetical protein
VALVRKRTIPTEGPPPVDEVSGRNAVFPADVEKQLCQRIVSLQVFWAYMKSRSQVLCSNMQGTQQPKSMEWQNDGKSPIYQLSGKEPRLSCEESRKYQLLPNDGI